MTIQDLNRRTIDDVIIDIPEDCETLNFVKYFDSKTPEDVYSEYAIKCNLSRNWDFVYLTCGDFGADISWWYYILVNLTVDIYGTLNDENVDTTNYANLIVEVGEKSSDLDTMFDTIERKILENPDYYGYTGHENWFDVDMYDRYDEAKLLIKEVEEFLKFCDNSDYLEYFEN